VSGIHWQPGAESSTHPRARVIGFSDAYGLLPRVVRGS
jgi:hypothetical protein